MGSALLAIAVLATVFTAPFSIPIELAIGLIAAPLIYSIIDHTTKEDLEKPDPSKPGREERDPAWYKGFALGLTQGIVMPLTILGDIGKKVYDSVKKKDPAPKAHKTPDPAPRSYGGLEEDSIVVL